MTVRPWRVKVNKSSYMTETHCIKKYKLNRKWMPVISWPPTLPAVGVDDISQNKKNKKQK